MDSIEPLLSHQVRCDKQEGDNAMFTKQKEFFCRHCKGTILSPPFFLCKESDAVFHEDCLKKKPCTYSSKKDGHIDFCIRELDDGTD